MRNTAKETAAKLFIKKRRIKMKKRFLAMVLSASMVTLMLTGCGSSSKDASSTTTAARQCCNYRTASGEKENVKPYTLGQRKIGSFK